MDNGRRQEAGSLTGLHALPMNNTQNLGNCKKDSYAFCCEVGTPCDCTKGTTAPGKVSRPPLKLLPRFFPDECSRLTVLFLGGFG